MKKIAGTGCLLLLTACAANAPGCGDPETIDVLRQVIGEMMKGRGLEEKNGFKYEIDAIRTSQVDEATGKQSCVAQLTISGETLYTKEPIHLKNDIRYTSELTSKSGEFYVNVEAF